MDTSYIVISAILNELQSQCPQFEFCVEKTTNTTYYSPGVITYTHAKWNYQEHRTWLYYYLHEDAYIGIGLSNKLSYSTYDTSYAYVHYSLLTPESLEKLTKYLRARLKAL